MLESAFISMLWFIFLDFWFGAFCMHTHHSSTPPRQARSWGSLTAVALAALGFAGAAQALDYGPFTLTGFAKGELVRGSNHCPDCQRFPTEDKQRVWADELIPGQPYGTSNTHVVLAQPWLAAKFDLGKGFKLTGLASQRWRDGKEDIPGYWYEKNVALSHEEYGRLALGAMTTRAWSLADYPYGTNIGVADVWGSSGSGYGLNTKAIRYTSRPFEVLEGDLVLEATYDQGNTAFKKNKPRFVEIYAQFHKGDLVVDAIIQDTRNGNPQAWSHGPFTGLTPFPADDKLLGGSGQGLAMVMARYQVNAKLEVSGGIRYNRWSGAYAVITVPGAQAQWNSMFNVDWGGKLNGVPNPGYAASTVDVSGGVRYRMGPWVAHTGLTYLGKASTANPSERGQSNAALVNTAGVSYDVQKGMQVYALAGMVHYDHLGLSPMSMPGNSAFTNVDSRVNKTGNWIGLGAVYVF